MILNAYTCKAHVATKAEYYIGIIMRDFVKAEQTRRGQTPGALPHVRPETINPPQCSSPQLLHRVKALLAMKPLTVAELVPQSRATKTTIRMAMRNLQDKGEVRWTMFTKPSGQTARIWHLVNK